MKPDYCFDDYKRDRQLLLDAALSGVEINSKFSSEWGLAKKIALLRNYDYNVLYGKGGCVIKLEECSNKRITDAFRKTYNSAKRNTAQYIQKVFPSLDNYKKYFKAEEQAKKAEQTDIVEQLAERIAIMLDSCTDLQRRILTFELGADKLGEYAMPI